MPVAFWDVWRCRKPPEAAYHQAVGGRRALEFFPTGPASAMSKNSKGAANAGCPRAVDEPRLLANRVRAPSRERADLTAFLGSSELPMVSAETISYLSLSRFRGRKAQPFGAYRGVAQSGSALALGACGRRFESYHPDYFSCTPATRASLWLRGSE